MHRLIAPGILVSVGVATAYLAAATTEPAPAYHLTRYSQYAQFVETSLAEANPRELALRSVVGGVAPHHIPTTIPLLAEFYASLGASREVDTIIIIGPDHVDAGQSDVSVSEADFIMPFGTLEANRRLIRKIVDARLASVDEAPFDHEHSIEAQLLLISKAFPDAMIVPMIIRSSMSNAEARALGVRLAELTDDRAFVVASVDFSHYLTEEQARPIDALSAEVLAAIDSRATPLVEADSEQSLVALISYLEAKGADKSVLLDVSNTKDFNDNNDYTTGYVAGFFGYTRPHE